MLNFFRQELKSFHWVLWLIIASFVVGFVFILQGTGGGGAGRMPVGTWAARIDGDEVSANEFYEAFRRQEDQLKQIFGDQYQRGRFLDPQLVLSGLVDRVLLEREAQRLGVDASLAQVADEIRSIPAFQHPDGRFDPERYQSYLQATRTSQPYFEQQVRRDMQIQALLTALRGSVTLSEPELRAEWLRRNEAIDLHHVLFPLQDYFESVSPDEQRLRSYFAEHESEYDAGPARRVRWVEVDRAAIQASLEDEAEMREYHEENADVLYTIGPDQRRASLLLVEVPSEADEGLREAAGERAERLAERARGGEDFAALVRAESDDETTRDDGGDLGPFYRGVLEPAVDEEVFDADEGDVVGPIETSRGFEILLVTKGEGETVRPFEEVRDAVSRGLYAARASEAARERIERLQEAFSTMPDLAEAARGLGLGVSDPRWVSRGDTIEELGPNPVLVSRIFETEPGEVTEPLPSEGGRVVFTVIDERETSPRTFEEAREAVEADLREEMARELAQADAEELRRRAIDSGQPLAELAELAGREVVESEGVKRGGSLGELGPAPEVLDAAFETPVGSVGPIADADEGPVVFRVVDRVELDPETFAAEREELRRTVEQQRWTTLRQALLDTLRARHEGEIEVNPAILEPLAG